MKVLGLSSYPVESAATRFRLTQFVDPLAKLGIELTVSPFLDSRSFKEFYSGGGALRKAFAMLPSIFKRIREIFTVRRYDLIFVQREAMLFGPPIFERLFKAIAGRPMVLDLDDATYLSYVSPSYGRLGSFFKAFGKTDKLIEKADLVICGNRFIAEYAAYKGSETIVVPTVADPNAFFPVEKQNDVPVVGWIGTHSTLPFLRSIFPVLEKLAAKHKFVLKIVGIPGVTIFNEKWSLEREIADFQSLDIGLYPISVTASANEEWLKGKSGFKAIQYLAVGVPFVMTPIGVCAEIGEPDVTHFNADTDDEWYEAIDKLLLSKELCKKMGQCARKHSEENYSVETHAGTLAMSLRRVAGHG
jgi:glycosyltransferase involved in cell wall biosynthesis